MKVLVTGAAGFIGSHVVDALRKCDAEVIGLDSLDAGVHHRLPDYLRGDVEYCFSDLRHGVPDARFRDVNVVVHLAALGGVSRAAREPANVLSANVVGTARLVEAARTWTQLRMIILGSSFSVYGSNYSYSCPGCGTVGDGARKKADLEQGNYEVYCAHCGRETAILPVNESTAPAPLEMYGASKYMQELCFRGFDTCPVHILRFSSVYGQRLRLDDGEATIIAKLAGWIRDGRRPSLIEDGHQIRDWVYVGDVVAAILALVEKAPPASLLNVCSGKPTQLDEACRLIARAMGTQCAPEIKGGYRPGDMRHCLGDCTALRKLIGRIPITLDEGAELAFAKTAQASFSAAS